MSALTVAEIVILNAELRELCRPLHIEKNGTERTLPWKPRQQGMRITRGAPSLTELALPPGSGVG